MSRRESTSLRHIYGRLYDAFGPQHWWPGDSPFEIIVGAILTQNTNWGNVEKAIKNLKKASCLTPEKLYRLPLSRLAALIKPSGFFNIKARRLRNFLDFLFKQYGGSVMAMAKEDWRRLRQEILAVNGIGPETADSILLYALGKPVFVVDAYTKRVFSRHQLVEQGADYSTVQDFFTRRIKPEVAFYNEYHALIVRLGKDFCRPRARCGGCPLECLLHVAVK